MRETHELEEALHHHFKNPALLVTALTHTSYANEAKHGVRHNERLEFLGDSILGMVVADHLYRNHPDLPEGELTRTRAALVCEHTLSVLARQLKLGDYLYMGNGEDALKQRADLVAPSNELGGVADMLELVLQGGV